MANPSKRKSDAARRANQVVRSRTMLMMALLGVATFVVLFWKLYDLQVRQHDELQEKAVAQQTRSTVITASRGTIYDRNGLPLALSATAETVFISPYEINSYLEEQEQKAKEEAAAAEEEGRPYVPPIIRDKEFIARGLGRILDVDPETILEKMEKTNSKYEIVKKRVDQEVADEVRRFINGEIDDEGNEITMETAAGKTVLKENPSQSPVKIRGVYMEPGSKRYYPYGSLASNVIGFVNGENEGGVGLEAKYNSILSGTAGLTVTARNAVGGDLCTSTSSIMTRKTAKTWS